MDVLIQKSGAKVLGLWEAGAPRRLELPDGRRVFPGSVRPLALGAFFLATATVEDQVTDPTTHRRGEPVVTVATGMKVTVTYPAVALDAAELAELKASRVRGTDTDMAAAVPALIDALVSKGAIARTDLPPAVRTALAARKAIVEG